MAKAQGTDAALHHRSREVGGTNRKRKMIKHKGVRRVISIDTCMTQTSRAFLSPAIDPVKGCNTVWSLPIE